MTLRTSSRQSTGAPRLLWIEDPNDDYPIVEEIPPATFVSDLLKEDIWLSILLEVPSFEIDTSTLVHLYTCHLDISGASSPACASKSTSWAGNPLVDADAVSAPQDVPARDSP